MRTRVKFCGMTRAEDVAAAAAAGADAVGFVFYARAAVAVDAAAAAACLTARPPFVDVVALFVNADADEVRRVIDTVRPQWLQFHGDETEEYCRQFALPYIKACRARHAEDISAAQRMHARADALLLDAHVDGMYGGTGKTFDWSILSAAPAAMPRIVAGGLTAATVGDLIRRERPYGVDVSGGIAEDGDRRRKNRDKMRMFMRSVRDADFH